MPGSGCVDQVHFITFTKGFIPFFATVLFGFGTAHFFQCLLGSSYPVGIFITKCRDLNTINKT